METKGDEKQVVLRFRFKQEVNRVDWVDLLVPLVRGPLCEVLTAPSVWGLSADWLAVSLSDSWTTKEGCLSLQVSQRAHFSFGLKSIYTCPLFTSGHFHTSLKPKCHCSPMHSAQYCNSFKVRLLCFPTLYLARTPHQTSLTNKSRKEASVGDIYLIFHW